MARPKIFLSSTCYDLSVVRKELDSFLNDLNFEVLNSETGKFGVDPGLHSHTACIAQVKSADYLVLLIGGRHGGTYIGSEKSITNEEYNAALKRPIPVIAFIKKDVKAAIPLYKRNPTANFSHVVDDKRVFAFVEYIQAAATDNWLFEFDFIDDLKTTLKAQFAHYLLRYSESLRQAAAKERHEDATKLDHVAFPSQLEGLKGLGFDQATETGVRNGLKQLHATMKAILVAETKIDSKLEKLKCLWVLAKHGQLRDDVFRLDNDTFKQFAWSTTRGRRVFKQLESFGVNGDYDEDDDYHSGVSVEVVLRFREESLDALMALALSTYVDVLTNRHGDDDGYQLFLKADMRIFMDSVKTPEKASAKGG